MKEDFSQQHHREGKSPAHRRFRQAILPLFLFLSGCASAMNGEEEKIFIYSTPEERANCNLYQGGQLVKHFMTPQTVRVFRSRELNLVLNCSKTHYQLYTQKWDPDLSGAYGANTGWYLALAPAISLCAIPLGAIFPSASHYDLSHDAAYGYPKEIEAVFKPLEKGQAEQKLPDHFVKEESKS